MPWKLNNILPIVSFVNSCVELGGNVGVLLKGRNGPLEANDAKLARGIGVVFSLLSVCSIMVSLASCLRGTLVLD